MYARESPGGLAASLAAQLAAQKGFTALLRRLGAPAVADAIAANMGAEQLGLGADWGQRINRQPDPTNGYDVVQGAEDRWRAEQQRRPR